MQHHLAWLFPGQGSQTAGMARELADDAPEVARLFAQASDLLGYDLAALIADDGDGRLHRTEYTQPALLVASCAMVRWWRLHGGPEPAHVAGHSLGEYSALVAAGAIEFADAVRLVALRGRAMARCGGEEGCMAAILGLEDAQVERLCIQASDGNPAVWPANLNCPGQVVVAGRAAAVARVVEQARAAGARRAVVLKVSAPSHTPLMADAAAELAEALESIPLRDPDRTLWSNATAGPVADAPAVRRALVAQLTSPVRWSALVSAMAGRGVRQAVEMGPGKVLMGLVRRIDRRIEVMTGDTVGAMGANLDKAGGRQ